MAKKAQGKKAKGVSAADAKRASDKPAAPANQTPAAAEPATQKFEDIIPESRIEEMKDKIMADTKPNTESTATAENAARDMQARMKAAYDKSSQFSGEMSETARGNAEAFVASGKILAEGVQSITRNAVEESQSAFETVTADLKKMAAIQSPTELFQLQSEIARRNFDAMVGYGSKNTEALVKLANDAFAPISSRASVVIEKVAKAA